MNGVTYLSVALVVGLVSGAVLDPPPHDQEAKMSRYILHNSNYGAMATISNRDPIKGYPFANVFSFSDGPLGQSSGIPYIYTMPQEISSIDLEVDPRASLTFSLAQSSYCKEGGFDPQDPRCAHVIFTGIFTKIDKESEEWGVAQEALFSRHPDMEFWPEDHGFFFAKIDIEDIQLLDWFGGVVHVDVEEYWKADPNAL